MTADLRIRSRSPDLPLVLARTHRRLPVGATVAVEVAGGWSADGWPDDGGPSLADLLVGGGFEPDGSRPPETARRVLTLPDTVGTGMRALVCGLNPSVVAAEAGYGYAGRSNRFWPAASAAGLVTEVRDPDHALLVDGVGMTDLVKRATTTATVLRPDEYRLGLSRVTRLVRWLSPERVVFVGLAGWRAAVDHAAVPGWQHGALGGAPAYVLPSTSGLNARTSLAALVDHMAAALADPPMP